MSLLAHIGLLLSLAHGTHVYVAPMRLPGTEHGTTLSLTYLPAAGLPQQRAVHQAASRPRTSAHALDVPAPAPLPRPAAVGEAGSGVPGTASLGEGDMTVALMQFFPDPRPDLSRLPPGTRGDVILQALIGADGRIAELTLKQGLGHGIDEAVIATVEQWTFHPALRDGHPVASEQELHFHYERAA